MGGRAWKRPNDKETEKVGLFIEILQVFARSFH